MRPSFEQLEGRVVLSVAGQDYVISGTYWNDIRNLTYSIVPDGTQADHGINIINSNMQSQLGDQWEKAIDQAIEEWEKALGVDFKKVHDNGSPFDAKGKEQGDPQFGDIRFTAYDFGNSTTTGRAYPPPPALRTAGGDISFNTQIDWNQYSLAKVAEHEIGHALGLSHVPDSGSVMYFQYKNNPLGLGQGDIDGVRNIYNAQLLKPIPPVVTPSPVIIAPKPPVIIAPPPTPTPTVVIKPRQPFVVVPAPKPKPVPKPVVWTFNRVPYRKPVVVIPYRPPVKRIAITKVPYLSPVYRSFARFS